MAVYTLKVIRRAHLTALQSNTWVHIVYTHTHTHTYFNGSNSRHPSLPPRASSIYASSKLIQFNQHTTAFIKLCISATYTHFLFHAHVYCHNCVLVCNTPHHQLETKSNPKNNPELTEQFTCSILYKRATIYILSIRPLEPSYILESSNLEMKWA